MQGTGHSSERRQKFKLLSLNDLRQVNGLNKFSGTCLPNVTTHESFMATLSNADTLIFMGQIVSNFLDKFARRMEGIDLIADFEKFLDFVAMIGQ